MDKADSQPHHDKPGFGWIAKIVSDDNWGFSTITLDCGAPTVDSFRLETIGELHPLATHLFIPFPQPVAPTAAARPDLHWRTAAAAPSVGDWSGADRQHRLMPGV